MGCFDVFALAARHSLLGSGIHLSIFFYCISVFWTGMMAVL
jgi:hypothetical protein